MSMPALVDNAADAKQVKNAERIERAKARDIDTSLKRTLDTYEGRHVLWSIIAECGVLKTPFSTDPITMAFNAGAQNKGLWLIAEIERVSPDAYMTMQRENQKREAKHG